MAKLNKTEIEAVANKIHTKIKKVAEQRKKDIIKNYKPSEIYLKCTELATERDRLEKEIEQIKDSLYNIGKEFDFWNGFKNMYLYEIQNVIIKNECKLKPLPSLDELKDEVTIAAIDKDFEINKFIENIVDKF